MTEQGVPFAAVDNVLFDSVCDCLVVIDSKGIVVTINPAAQKQLQYSKEEVIGQNVKLLMPPEVAAEHDGYISAYLRTGDAQVIGKGRQVKVRRKDGSTFPADLAVTRMEVGEALYFVGSLRDMTERFEAEEALRKAKQEAEDALRVKDAVLASIYDCVLVIDSKGIIQTVNPAVEKNLQYTKEELIGQNVKLLMPPEIAAEHDGYISGYLRTGDAKVIGKGREVMVRRKDGSTFPADLAVTRMEVGDTLWFVGSLRDMSERVEAEDAQLEAKKEVEAALQVKNSVLASIYDCVIVIDSKGIMQTVNPSVEKNLQYSKEELIGQNVKMLMPSDVAAEHDGYISGYLRTGDAKVIGKGREVRVRRKDGSTFPADLAVTRMPVGETLYFVGSLRDMTERFEAEEALRQAKREVEEALRQKDSVFSSIYDCVLVIDSKGIIQTVNPAVEGNLQYSKEELVGENVKLLMPPEVAAEHDGYISAYLRTGDAKVIGKGRQVMVRRKDGSTFPADLAVTRMEVGEALYFVGSLRDMTERFEAEEALRKAKQQAEAALRVKASVLATMSHEIRTPMSGIIAMAQMLRDEPNLPGPAQSHVKTIISASRCLVQIINEILDYSKLEAGKMKFLPSVCRLSEVASEVHTLMAARGHENGLRFDLDLGEGTDVPVTTDQGKLRQILLNLVGNALKFTPAGSVLLRLRVNQLCQKDSAAVQQDDGGGNSTTTVNGRRSGDGEQQKPENALAVSPEGGENDESPGSGIVHQIGSKVKVVFAVEDSGVGISPEFIQRLFDPWTQEDSASTKKHGGSGLGLSICKRFAELLGGEISVTSKQGEGSVFSVSFVAEVASCAESSCGSGGDTRRASLNMSQPDTCNFLNLARDQSGTGSVGVEPQGGELFAPCVSEGDRGVVETSGGHRERLKLHASGAALEQHVQSQQQQQQEQSCSTSHIFSRCDDQSPTRSAKPFQGVRALVVDDNDICRTVMGMLLNRFGCELETVCDGASAISLLFKDMPEVWEGGDGDEDEESSVTVDDILSSCYGQSTVASSLASRGIEYSPVPLAGFDMVFLDMHMPCMDGYECAREIRRKEKKLKGRGRVAGEVRRVPIIACTASVLGESIEKIFACGVDEVLPKPVEVQAVKKVLTTWAAKSPGWRRASSLTAEGPGGQSVCAFPSGLLSTPAASPHVATEERREGAPASPSSRAGSASSCDPIAKGCKQSTSSESVGRDTQTTRCGGGGLARDGSMSVGTSPAHHLEACSAASVSPPAGSREDGGGQQKH
uniref:histidine kinase n=1 Tax=Chromera velia CCMP2878 TaxID=1169474 RepID=A0A0G4HHW9_9ALVE|eukprot:Cvel_6872.t1-p1 / transcript=Cvel_6872.t1 / gene=Cvel_6872 / organism=Chromera_velia_CCMP2878 / gene_product=Histidine kinase 4, putative / transcript_product=Histidine kinase 4, putative / location=Cvel_scaffold347:47654-54757(+) / protein_length=1271 / sequence_SO=supercontig / SO=protein_coding / is_pseudo=false